MRRLMNWRPGLRASIALTVVLVTLVATVGMGLVTYKLQAGGIWDRFIVSAQAGFESDVEQAHQALVETPPLDPGPPGTRSPGAESPGAMARWSKPHQVAHYMNGRLGLTWAVLAPAPGNGGRFEIVEGTSGFFPGQLPANYVNQAVQQRPPVAYTADSKAGSQYVLIGQVDPYILLAEFYNTQKLNDDLTTLRWQIGEVSIVVTLLGVLIGFFAAGRIQGRVRTAAVAARQLGDGALDTRLPVRGSDEFADLAGSFNAMAQRLGESIEQLRVKDQQQRRFVADVAHDLRTPLASMIAATESLRSPDEADRERSAELVGAQVRRLGTLVEDLLEMSRFDSGAADFRPEPVDLEALVADAAALSAPDVTVPVRCFGRAAVVGDPRRLHTIMRNLLTNAVRHGAEPITVTIDGTAADWVTVAVADSGPGLPAELAPFVFDRFVRGDRARRQTEGSGLGLAIAHENAVLHGGWIDVTSHADGHRGAVFVLTIPREPARTG